MVSGAIAALLLLGASGAVRADDTPATAPGAGADAPPPAAADAEKPKLDPRKVFATNCSWCHGDFGLKAGKGGPKLAGTAMSADQVRARIVKGKSGSMPGYEKTLSSDQIDVLVEYIKGLKDPG